MMELTFGKLIEKLLFFSDQVIFGIVKRPTRAEIRNVAMTNNFNIAYSVETKPCKNTNYV